jgi:ABC-type transport system substrate-binding protein
VSRYAYDPTRAAALLKEAGWTAGSDGILAKDGARLSFGTDVEIYENLPDIVVAIQGQLRKVGIEIKPQPVEFNTWLDRLRKGQFDLSFTAWAGSADPDNVSYTTFHSTGSRNLNGYATRPSTTSSRRPGAPRRPPSALATTGSSRRWSPTTRPTASSIISSAGTPSARNTRASSISGLGRGHPVASQGVVCQVSPRA